ncbi:MAG: YggS family pyridoxal phosphate-dependent enzyme [Bacteroidales bacterium]|jgi:pyridoxal phosphate enzyme (YggS family)|nr:YggS family pyridoxal phosphate-dependent enzyme [Bacteroidales bacterium]
MSITENLLKIKNELQENVKLVAVSKTKPEADIIEAYNSGHKIFGENKVQELVDKHEKLPKDIEWHFIGHLQTNKVKYLAPFVHLIHGVDSLKLLKEINKQGAKNDRILSCLLQFHIATEDAKFGLHKEEAFELLQSAEFQNLKNVQIVGVMGMATYTDDENQIREEFANLKSYFNEIRDNFITGDYFNEISMGMSADYKIAIEEGSTLIRLGSSVFGIKFYTKF